MAEWNCDTPWRRLILRFYLADSLHCKVIFELEFEGIQDLLEPVRIPPLSSTNGYSDFVRDSSTSRVLVDCGLGDATDWSLEETS